MRGIEWKGTGGKEGGMERSKRKAGGGREVDIGKLKGLEVEGKGEADG